MPNTAECIGVILAGGASTRMGTDKASLLWHGVPMHQHLRAVLLAAGAGRVILSGRAELDGGLADQNPGQGPLAALASVVNSIAPQKAWLLVLAVDTPKLAAHTLQLLRPPGELDYHCFQEHVLPFGVQLNDKTRQTVSACAQHNDPKMRSFRHWFAQLDGAALASTAEISWQLQSANTPQQWRALL